MLALPNIKEPIFTLTEEILQSGFQASSQSPRKRIILPLHRTQDALVQRMLNFFQPGTYVQPHIHSQDHQIETVQVLRGKVGVIFFDEAGEVTETHQLAEGGVGLVDFEPGIWHGMVCLEPNTVILEIKRGPYSPDTDKYFADWAPAEGDEGCDAFREKMEALF